MSRTVQRRRAGLSPEASAVAVMAAIAVILLVILIAGRDGGEAEQVQADPAGALCVVCIDPGHGGGDQGTSWEGRLEKDDNLAVALALQQALEKRNIRAVLTREEDAALTLEERVAFAQEQQADLYISLHRNYSDQPACGVELWVAEQCSETSEALARRVNEGLAAVGVQRDRGVRFGSQSGEGDYYVLSHTAMPAVLVELGFIQDAEDNRLLDEHREDYAAAIADAVEAVWKEGNPSE